jgi:hypothetical protein
MQIQFKDVNEILNKVKHGEGNYTPLEIELAKMAYRYRCKIAEMTKSKALMFDSLFSAYSALQNSPFGADLMHRRAASLASQSKAHFAQAVKLDNQLKGLINDGNSENKD